jgi:hypothetical protein
MKRKFIIVPIALFFCATIQAQRPVQLLSNWSEKSPIQKVYLHFDRDNYIAGETAWFKAYLYSDYQPDTISTSLYAELVNDSGTVLSRSIVPVFLGTTNGQFELPDSLATGSYLIRAYSPTMLNQGTDFTGRLSILIYGKKRRNAEPVSKEKLIRLDFFPEGGNLVSGFSNTVAFKASDENGLPAAVKGNILNEKNEVITTFGSYHDGMGMFGLAPAVNEKYYAVMDGDAAAKKYYLPGQTHNGITLTVMPHPQGNFFELKQQKDNPAFRVAYMIGQMQHHIVFKQEFKAGKEELQGIINTKKLYSGILQITFFNKDDQPLAERLCFVNNKEYIQQGELIADTINFSERGRNRISIQLKDTVQGSFSVSITDPAYSLWPEREENIFSNLLLTSDLKGYIHKPAYYFSGDNDSVKTALDLLMMTNGWRRFKWEQLLKEGLPLPGFKDKAYISLAGKVNLQNTKRPFADKQLLLFITGTNGKRSTQFIQTDNQGNFTLDSLVFYDKARLLFSDVRGKKSQYIDVLMNDDSVRKTFLLPVTEKFKPYSGYTAGNNSRWKTDYDAILKVNGIMLEEVRLKAQKKNPLQEVDERYTAGMFSGDATKAIDLVNNDEAGPYQNIFDYLQARVNGLQISADGFDYSVYFRQGASISSMGNIAMTLFLDEIETDASVIATIPASQVALVKVYNSFAGAWGNAPGGVLAVYTKKGQDYLNSATSFANNRIYNGYTVIKEFYAPDYAVDKPAEALADNRITLDWRPDILVNNVNPKIPVTFYNNDRAKSFKIVVEGMTVDGKMLMIERTISHKGF